MSDDIGERAREWWRTLRTDAAGCAALRRCRVPIEALMHPQTYRLISGLGWRGDRGERVAALAAILGHVSEDDARPLARALGNSRFGADDATLSEARFRRLIATDEINDLQLEMTRLVALAGGAVSVSDLAWSVLFWNDKTRARWASLYYAAIAQETDQ